MRPSHSWHKLSFAYSPEAGGEGPDASFHIEPVDVILSDGDEPPPRLWRMANGEGGWRRIDAEERWRFAADEATLVSQAADRFGKDLAEAETKVRVLNHYLREALADQAQAATLLDGVLKHGVAVGVVKKVAHAAR